MLNRARKGGEQCLLQAEQVWPCPEALPLEFGGEFLDTPHDPGRASEIRIVAGTVDTVGGGVHVGPRW
jgi:hypothetical protein